MDGERRSIRAATSFQAALAARWSYKLFLIDVAKLAMITAPTECAMLAFSPRGRYLVGCDTQLIDARSGKRVEAWWVDQLIRPSV